MDKRSLLYSNIEFGTQNIDGQKNTYQKSVESIRETIAEYEGKKVKLMQTKECIRLKENRFSIEDSYYGRMIQNYLAARQLTAAQYDSQIQECERVIKTSDASIASWEGERLRLQKELEEVNQLLNTIMAEQTPVAPAGNVSQNTISGNQLAADNNIKIDTLRNQIIILQEQLTSIESELTSLRMNKDTTNQKAETLSKEKEQALANMELEQLSALEQQIENINNTILSLESNATSAQIQLDSVERQDTAVNREIQILTEKGNVAAQILTYESKTEEYEQQLKSFDIQNGNCIIVANTAGYFHRENDLKVGAFIQEGTALGRIYPEEEGRYYAEIYVENTDIGKLREGQTVNFEIAAYPSDEYGYFTGKVVNIAKDISVNSGTGSAYYIVKAACDSTSVTNKQGEEGRLMNGMACQARIVVDDQSVLKYLL